MLEKNHYLKNYTLKFIKLNNEDLQHWFQENASAPIRSPNVSFVFGLLQWVSYIEVNKFGKWHTQPNEMAPKKRAFKVLSLFSQWKLYKQWNMMRKHKINFQFSRSFQSWRQNQFLPFWKSRKRVSRKKRECKSESFRWMHLLGCVLPMFHVTT